MMKKRALNGCGVRLASLLWLVGALGCGAQTSDPGSETHWLSASVDGDVCPVGVCECGICTDVCVKDEACANAGKTGRCASVGASAARCGGDSVFSGERLYAPEGEASGATVVGTLTLPAVAAGAPFGVRIGKSPQEVVTMPVGLADGVAPNAQAIDYSITGVPAGTYVIVAFVDIDGSGGDGSTPGDFAGWFGHTGDGNPPGDAPNVVVPESGTVRFDINLIER